MENNTTLVFKRRKKKRIPIPKYSLSEEITSSLIHGIGALFSVAALVLCLVKSAQSGSALTVVCSAIFGSFLILQYTISTIYHAFKVNQAKRVFRVIDHCCIFMLIAATYTPYTLLSLKGAWGWVIFGIVWGAAVFGVVFNSIDLKKFKIVSMITYVAMGWVILIAVKPLIQSVEPAGLWLLLAGGVSYTLGAVIYGAMKKKKFSHPIFHLFTLMGSVLQFFSIYFYII